MSHLFYSVKVEQNTPKRLHQFVQTYLITQLCMPRHHPDRTSNTRKKWMIFNKCRATGDYSQVMMVDLDIVKEAQRVKFGPYFAYLGDSTTPLPPKETIETMSYYFERDDVLYCSYFPDHLRKRSSFVPQLARSTTSVSKCCMTRVPRSCMSVGHVELKQTHDKVCDRFKS